MIEIIGKFLIVLGALALAVIWTITLEKGDHR